ncbi:hypothetical protein BC834DRAFT_1044564 [Gloeopeniophorella convolvens]|nr:hypothetical protein BC834DRAFT_1044564 [Gloeopeniophorella convolvens]
MDKGKGKRKAVDEHSAQSQESPQHDHLPHESTAHQASQAISESGAMKPLPPAASLLKTVVDMPGSGASLFRHVILELSENEEWGAALNPCLRDKEDRGRLIADYDIVPAIEKCRVTGDWDVFFKNRPFLFRDSFFARRQAWQVNYEGDRADLLFATLCEMRFRRGGLWHTSYKNIAAVIQSSGYGKSRMVDEHAKIVFTFPIDLRSPAETKHGTAFPPPDAGVRKYFLRPQHGEANVRIAYLSFFTALFDSAAELVEREVAEMRGGTKFPGSSELATWWHGRLNLDGGRERFYESVVFRSDDLIYSIAEARSKRRETMSPDSAQHTNTTGPDPALFDESAAAKEAYRRLARILTAAIAVDENYPVKMVVYFDEVKELAIAAPQLPRPNTDGGPPDTPERPLIDILCSSLDIFKQEPMMFLLLSTTTNLGYAFTAPNFRRGSGRRLCKTIDYTPINELPFDCHPSFPLDGTAYSLDDISDPKFLARFGRPLFWASLTNGGPKDYVIELARRKLAGPAADSDVPTMEAQTAVVDLLVLLDYATSHTGAEALQQCLVASHMCTAASFSQGCGGRIVCSGYPSEPLLAEAAASLLESWQLERKINRNMVIQLVSDHYSNGLLVLGDAGELVARILLTQGYHAACQQGFSDSSAARPRGTRTYYSKGCKLKTFLRCTFVESSSILAAKPDNPDLDSALGSSLESALGDAIVRFTHFSKWDQKGASHLDAHSSFLRGAAIVYKVGQRSVDIIIPILVRTEGKACPHAITAILVQVQRRKQGGPLNALLLDETEIGFFPKKPPSCNCCSGPLTSPGLEISRLPYLSLLLGLRHDHAQSYRRLRSSEPPPPPGHWTDSPGLHVSSAPTSGYTRLQGAAVDTLTHPRYGIYVGGCSPGQFESVTDSNHEDYRYLLLCSAAGPGTHPRQGSEHIRAVKELSLSRGYRETERWTVPGDFKGEMEEVE